MTRRYRSDFQLFNFLRLFNVISFPQSVRTHIVHLSTAEALPTICHLREQIGERLTVETCHHYLTLASEDVPHGRVDFKCCPPIRDRYNREQLWKAIKSHDINLVVSDHSPSTPELKLLNEGPDKGNFLRSWGGISSIQFGMFDPTDEDPFIY